MSVPALNFVVNKTGLKKNKVLVKKIMKTNYYKKIEIEEN